jgi:hypothetical protein
LSTAKPSASEDATQIVADSGEDDVCSVTLTAFEIATTEVTVGLHVADHGRTSLKLVTGRSPVLCEFALTSGKVANCQH